jgi:hypothetical protein
VVPALVAGIHETVNDRRADDTRGDAGPS